MTVTDERLAELIAQQERLVKKQISPDTLNALRELQRLRQPSAATERGVCERCGGTGAVAGEDRDIRLCPKCRDCPSCGYFFSAPGVCANADCPSCSTQDERKAVVDKTLIAMLYMARDAASPIHAETIDRAIALLQKG